MPDAFEVFRSIPAPSHGPFEPTWESLRRYKVPKWYADAKLGIFIHWGVYSVPAFGNEWYPRHMYIPE
ncbi:MAG: alpha-L-fucosidase, partial [Thermoprotei archaeon]